MKKPKRNDPNETDRGMLPELVGYHLRRAQNAVFNHFIDSLADQGVSPGQFGVLTLIDANEGLSQSELARTLKIERSTMVAVIDRLEAQGWVDRKLSETDRRSYALALTKAGTELLSRARPLVRDHERRINADLGKAEKAMLIDLLDRVASAAHRR